MSRHALSRKLFRAIQYEDLDVCQDIVDALGDANAYSCVGEPALYVAAKTDRLACCRILLNAKADVNATFMMSTPLHAACDEGLERIVSFLINVGKANVAARDSQQNTPLHRVLNMRPTPEHMNVCRTLIDHGAPMNAQNYRGKTPLMVAIQNGYDQAVQLFIDRGCDLNIVDERAQSALHYAIIFYAYRHWKLLIEKNANVHLTDHNGKTPLHLATQFGIYDCVQTLLAKGADVHAQDMYLRTPLHMAVSRDDSEMLVLLLLQHTTDRVADNEGLYPEDMCVPVYRPMIINRWKALHAYWLRTLVLGWGLPKDIVLLGVIPFLSTWTECAIANN